MNCKKRMLSLLLVVALLTMPLYAQAAGGITGTVKSGGKETGKVTLSLVYRGGVQAIRTTTVTGNSSTYALAEVEDGLYTLQASKYNHVSREYDVVVTGGALSQDVELRLLGDVTGEGKVNMGDTNMTYAHVRKTALMEDDYVKRCADINGDGNINMGDVGNLYSIVRNPVPDVEVPPLPQQPVEDNKDEPIEIGSTLSFDAEVPAGHLSYYHLYRVSGTSLTIENPMAYVIYNGVTYEAEDGKVTVPDLYSDNNNTPIALAIGNRGSEDQVFSVNLSYPLGHHMNPIPLPSRDLSTYCKKDDSQGVYYTFTAEKAGTLTIRLSQAVDCNITITSTAVEGGTRSVSRSENPESDSVAFKMAAGETVIVCVVMNPVNGFNYPEATVKASIRFR